MAALELPTLDERKCVGCGDCVLLCPVDCLEMAGPLPWLPRPGRCVSCTLCVRSNCAAMVDTARLLGVSV